MKWDTTWLRLRHRTSSLAGWYVTRGDKCCWSQTSKMPSASVCMSIAWVLLVMFLRCCAISDVKRSKTSDFLNVSIKNMVANIYVQDCVEHKTRTVVIFKSIIYSRKWDSLDDLADIVAGCAVCSGYPLVSSNLAKMLGFKGYLPLPLSPTPRSKWELG